MMSVADEIAKLDALQQSGAITGEEYEKLKAALLEKQVSGPPDPVPVSMPTFDVNNWAMFIHLSQFCGYVIPLAGFIVPIVLWQVKKEKSAVIHLHGKIVANCIITVLIILLALYLLSQFLAIKIRLELILAVVHIAAAIIGGVKANSGEAWPYPFTFKLFTLDE